MPESTYTQELILLRAVAKAATARLGIWTAETYHNLDETLAKLDEFYKSKKETK